MDEKNLNQENIDEGITLVELFNSLKQNLVLMLGIGILVVLLGIIYTWFIVTPMYTSSVDIHIKIENIDDITNPSYVNVSIVNQVKQNIKEIAKYPEIIEAVIEDLNLPYNNLEAKVNSIRGRIRTSDIGSASAVKISYEVVDPVMATRIVIAIAEETKNRINIEESEKENLAYFMEQLEVVNRPRENPNQAPSSPNKVLNLAISVVLGGIIAVVIVILKEQFSSYFKTKSEVEKFTKYSVIAEIPARKGVKFGE